jgi:hypothetical protein
MRVAWRWLWSEEISFHGVRFGHSGDAKQASYDMIVLESVGGLADESRPARGRKASWAIGHRHGTGSDNARTMVRVQAEFIARDHSNGIRLMMRFY